MNGIVEVRATSSNGRPELNRDSTGAEFLLSSVLKLEMLDLLFLCLGRAVK